MNTTSLSLMFAVSLFAQLLMTPLAETHAAAIPTPTDPYGGRSYFFIECTCNNSVLVYVGPPRPGRWLYTRGASTLYEWGNIYPPAWQLGIALPFGQCRIVSPHSGCHTEQADGTMIKDGTSLI